MGRRKRNKPAKSEGSTGNKGKASKTAGEGANPERKGADEPARPFELEELEARILLSTFTLQDPGAATGSNVEEQQLSADEIAGLGSSSDSSSPTTFDDADALDAAEAPAADEVRRELVLIDEGIEDYDQLLNDLLANSDGTREFEVLLLSNARDGIEQITDILNDYQDLDAIHIVSHGDEGAVQLGDAWLSESTLASYEDQLRSWSESLSDDADLLFYGCDLAGSESGEALVSSLAKLTGADIAASEDLTGHESLGGDWELEYQKGSIEAGTAFSAELQQDWGHALSVGIDATSTGTSVGTGFTVSHTTSGSDRLMLVGVTVGNTPGVTVDSVTYNGSNLSLVGISDFGGETRVEIWALVTPDAGTHDVVINLTGGSATQGATAGVMTFTGVDQSNPLGDFASASGESNSGSTTVNSAVGEVVFGVIGRNDVLSLSPGAGQMEYWDIGAGDTRGGGTTEAGATSVTTSWSWGVTDTWAIGAVSIKPSATSNAAPTLVNNAGLTAAEGSTTVITNTQLGYTDAQQPASSIVYSVTSTPANGQLELTTNPGVAITSFTQAQIDAGNVVYVHGGSETAADSFGFTVDDGQGNYASGPSIVGIGTLTNVTSGISNARAPDYSPDGSQIVFARNNDIYIMDADGSNQTPLVTAAGGDFQAVWSPDGTRIAFTSNRDGNNEIYVINVDGTNETRITSHAASDSAPAWSPDSSKIAFTSDRDGDKEIWVMDADGTNLVQLTDNTAITDGGASWSPDGSKIVFQSTRDGGDYEIYVMDADGSNQVRLTSDVGIDALGDWSPDGSKLLFYSERDGNREIYVMDADGSNPVRLTNDAGIDMEAEWSPDGSSILFTSDRDGDYDVYSASVMYENTFAIAVTPVNNAPSDLLITSTSNGGLSINQDGGNDAYFIADDGEAILGGLTAFTTEVQFAMDSFVGTQYFASYETISQSDSIRIGIHTGGEIRLLINGSRVDSTAMDYRTLADGEQHTLSVTWDSSGGLWEIFVDGVSVDSGSGLEVGASISTGSGTLVYGNEQDGVESGYDTVSVLSATLYDIRIFGDVRSGGEIAANYDQTVASTEPGLLANWTFNDLSTGGVVTDAVSGNNLTLQHASGAGFVASTPTLTAAVNENAANGTAVATVTGIDPDAGDTLSYALTDDAGGRFAIDASGQITVADGSLLDYESAASHDITVRVTDAGGLDYSETFTITLSDVDDPATIGGDTGYSGNEGDAVTGALTATDAEGLTDGTYFTVTAQATNGTAAIDPATGAWTFTPTDPNWFGSDSFEVTVTDDLGGSTTQIVSVDLSNVNDPVAGQPAITGTPTEDQTLTVDTSGITDADGLGVFAYQWYADGVAISGATNSTYTLTQNEVGAAITVEASYTDAQGAAESTVSAATAPVANVNDAPVLSAANNLTAIDEDDFANGGTLVSDLLAGQVSDVDSGALEGIAVIAVDGTNGTWEYTTDGGSTWTAFGAVGTSNARLLAADADTSVRFVPNADWNGTVTNGITFHAWDQTSGTAGSTTDLTDTYTVRDEFSTTSFSNNDGTATSEGSSVADRSDSPISVACWAIARLERKKPEPGCGVT